MKTNTEPKKGFHYDCECTYCHAPARKLHPTPKGKRSKNPPKTQASQWRVCDNGHKFVHKAR